jgi:post-segregation antitoxin (ccd killing protein)
MTKKKDGPPHLKIEKTNVTLSLLVSTDEELSVAAKATGISRSAYADRAITEQIKRDGIK